MLEKIFFQLKPGEQQWEKFKKARFIRAAV